MLKNYKIYTLLKFTFIGHTQLHLNKSSKEMYFTKKNNKTILLIKNLRWNIYTYKNIYSRHIIILFIYKFVAWGNFFEYETKQ